MSKIAVSGDVSGTATFEIKAPATNTNRLLILPDVDGNIVASVGGVADSTTFLRGDGVWQVVEGVPSGTVIHFAANTAPSGWLKANGAAISRTTYATLFAVIGTTYGAGDGSTTFNLPDLRGEFLRGWDDGRGVDTGRAIGSAQSHQMQSHAHNPASGTYFKTVSSGTRLYYSGSGGSYSDELYTTATNAQGGTNNGSENRPRNIALLACIKY